MTTDVQISQELIDSLSSTDDDCVSVPDFRDRRIAELERQLADNERESTDREFERRERIAALEAGLREAIGMLFDSQFSTDAIVRLSELAGKP